jgi:ABC-type multidrug transport system fused ATPase/permease subunit
MGRARLRRLAFHISLKAGKFNRRLPIVAIAKTSNSSEAITKPSEVNGAPAQAVANSLRGEGLTKVYGGRAVVDNVDVNVKPGEVVGFLGPNGAGKTTTFYMLVGLLKPDTGRVVFGEEDITTLPLYQRARRGISYLPQEPSVFRKLTVEENLLAVLETLPLTDEERRARLQSLLDELGIAKLASPRPACCQAASAAASRSPARWCSIRFTSAWTSRSRESIR